MSTPAEFAAAVQAVAEALRAAADDPADQVRLLAALADFRPAEATGADAVGAAMGEAQAAVGDLCRRAAVVALARAAAAHAPASYDAAVALRDLACGLLEAEVTAAADQGEDATAAALRALRAAVAEDLTARAADLARLRDVRTAAPLPALALAHRLYGDAGRADELAAYAGAADPNFLPVEFRALSR